MPGESKILELLSKGAPGRYIEGSFGGRYRVKEANGVDVVVKDDYGRDSPVEPSVDQINAMWAAGHLDRNGSRYTLRQETA